ncbi:hypothetical protein HOLleu_11911 [Holothuria leucospilota]|uniref:Uncharacterized protein n=1 Tax=Holothuria leucospilota TaxID=206669 RepID=A0A9Q1H9R8_HOLLE|nr:hypothetical protein HOLleu_11911 [Holothuria leucospilota]
MFSSMPEIHVCSRLTDENNQLIRKLKKLKKRNNTLEEELREINEKLKFENFVKENTLKVHTCTQTDVPGYKPLVVRPKPTNQQLNKKDDQQKQIDSLLKMHKSLMKKYQRELKNNSKHLETIAALNHQEKHVISFAKYMRGDEVCSNLEFNNWKTSFQMPTKELTCFRTVRKHQQV